MITRQRDTIWSQSAAGRGHQHRPAYDNPHSVYHADKGAREYGEALGAKHHHESKHSNQPRDRHGRFLPMPHHEKEKKDAADDVRRRGGEELERHFHEGYERGHKDPDLIGRREETRERHEKEKSEKGTHHHKSSVESARRKNIDDDYNDEDLGGDGFSDVTAPWEAVPKIDPEEEEAWSKNPTRVPQAPRITEKVLQKDPYILERHEIANMRGLRPKGLHLSQPKGELGHLVSEPQHYFNDDQTHNFSVVHHVVDPAHSKSGMWEVHRWKYSSDPQVGGSVEVSHHLPNQSGVTDVVGQLEANHDWDKHEGIGGRRVNKEYEERYVHEHPQNNLMLDPIQYEIRFVNSHRKNREGDGEYYYDPDSDNNRWMPHPSGKGQFRGPHWMVTTRLWQRDHQFDPRSDGRYVPVDHTLFHPDDAHGALRYVYADQHGGSLRPREGSVFSHLF